MKIASIIIAVIYIALLCQIFVSVSKNKTKGALLATTLFVLSLLIPWGFMKIPIVKTICIGIFAVYGVLFMGSFILGHIVGMFSNELMEKFARLNAAIAHCTLFALPILPGFLIIGPWIS